MDTSSLNGKKRRVTAKVCYILFLIVIFVCMENDFQYLRSSPEWEQSSTEFFRTIHFKIKREFSTATNYHGLSVFPCVVWSMIFARPRTSVSIRVDLSRENSTERMK